MLHQIRFYTIAAIGFALLASPTAIAATSIPTLPQLNFAPFVAQGVARTALQVRPKGPARKPNQKPVSPWQVAIQALQAAQKEIDGKTSTAALNAALADAKAAEDIVTELAKNQPKKSKDTTSDIDTALKNVKEAVKAIKTRKPDEAGTSITAAIDALNAAEKAATGAATGGAAKPAPKTNN